MPRGLARCRFAALRFHPALRYRERASVQPCRRWGASTGMRCALAGPTGPLLVGEGIETALSVVITALSAASLGAFAPTPGLTRLVIARDNDDEGERAAQRLARRCARACVAATVVVSEDGDFNDDLVALGAPALPARLAPVFADGPPCRE